MTLPLERSRSLKNTRDFLYNLLDPKKTPRIPKEIRKQAYYLLKHFPADHDINYAADGAPNHFGHLEELDDRLLRMAVEGTEKPFKKSSRKKKK